MKKEAKTVTDDLLAANFRKIHCLLVRGSLRGGEAISRFAAMDVRPAGARLAEVFMDLINLREPKKEGYIKKA